MKRHYVYTSLLWLALLLTACSTTPPETASSPAGEGTLDVIKSPNDQRSYDYFELPNRLQVLVISDPEAEKAAVSLNVATGSQDDPADREGLAHFLEHMLFLGTKKFPVAGEYQQFIATHGGQHNAFTSFEDTNYFFDISSPYLEPALDRFSQFFISPLFTAKYVEREKHAVESEYRAKYNDEGRRGLDVFKTVINPDHPFAQFSVGSLDTLAERPDAEVRDDLLKFYESHYSANDMNLVVLGAQTTAELRAIVEQLFSAVPDRDLTPANIEEPMFTPGSLPMEVFITPQQDIRSLDMVFPIPESRLYWQAKPVHMLGDILGHEGEGSLLQYLKRKGWADGLSAGTGLEYRGGGALNISISLTEAGYGARDQVVNAVFQAINRIAAQGINLRRFEEQQKIGDIQFRYHEKSENVHFVLGLAGALEHYPPSMVLKAPYELSDYEPQLYTEFLAQLVPDNVMITVTGPGLATDSKSPHYQTPYAVRPLSAGQLQQWRNAGVNPAIVMPAPNPYIPEEFERLTADSPQATPVKLLQQDKLRLWHGDDPQFAAPRASLRLGLYSPLANDSARHVVLLQLYAAVVADSLNPKLYPALLTGFNTSVGASRHGLEVGIDGFSDKQEQLLELILVEIQRSSIDPGRFDDIKQRLMRDWQNSKLQAPYQYLPGALRNALYTPYWNEDDKLAVVAALGPQDLEAYRKEFLANLRVDILSYGNISAQRAISLQQQLDPLLQASAGASELPGIELTLLDDQQRWRYPLDLDHADAAIVYYVQGQSDDNEQRVLMGLTGQIIQTPYYQSLRTEQQLGYVVYASTTVLERWPGLSFIVQSPVADAATLVSASEQLMQQFEQIAEQMTPAEFEQHKRALVSLINRPHKNLYSEAGFFWDQILQNYDNFDRREQLTLALQQLELDQWREFYRENFLPLPRRALIISQTGERKAAPGGWADIPSIGDVNRFKQRHSQQAYP